MLLTFSKQKKNGLNLFTKCLTGSKYFILFAHFCFTFMLLSQDLKNLTNIVHVISKKEFTILGWQTPDLDSMRLSLMKITRICMREICVCHNKDLSWRRSLVSNQSLISFSFWAFCIKNINGKRISKLTKKGLIEN